MAISMSKYISIVSGVGGRAVAVQKDMILRVFTTSEFAPFNKVLEFSGDAASALKAVGGFFGTTSNEYYLASKYFGWVSPKITTATKISFARYADTAIAPTLIPTKRVPNLSELKQITDGSMKIVLGGVENDILNLDFSTANSLSDIATIIQQKINGASSEVLWSSATVSFITNRGFKLTGGETGANTIGYAGIAASGTDISSLIGWSEATMPVISDGADEETIIDALDRTTEISNNFASFAFIDNLDVATIEQVAGWTQTQNFRFVYCVGVNDSTYSDVANAVKDKDCVAVTYDPNGERQEIIPAIIAAATPYERINGVIGMMYRQFDGFNPTVSTDEMASILDALRINYLGVTQKSGQLIAFYQDGYDMAGMQLQVDFNEIYLKDSIDTACINLLTAVGSVPYNETGDGMFRSVVIPRIESCKGAGIIIADKPLNDTQKAYVDNTMNEEGAWRDLENVGYTLDSQVEEFDDNGTTKYKWNYILLYAKGDIIVKVTGSDILI